jgi:hypothetical protein
VGGVTATGTVTLSNPAPAGGVSVALQSSNGSAASGPSTVAVSPGASSASFTINTGGVSAATSVTLTASYAGVNKTAILTVNPAAGITGADSQNITATGATIVWTTNVPATSGVKYGSTSGYGCASPSDPNRVLSHSVNLTGLMPSTLYHFQAVSVDASGNRAVSADSTFTTLPAGRVVLHHGQTVRSLNFPERLHSQVETRIAKLDCKLMGEWARLRDFHGLMSTAEPMNGSPCVPPADMLEYMMRRVLSAVGAKIT